MHEPEVKLNIGGHKKDTPERISLIKHEQCFFSLPVAPDIAVVPPVFNFDPVSEARKEYPLAFVVVCRHTPKRNGKDKRPHRKENHLPQSSHLNSRPKQPPLPPNLHLENPLLARSPQRPPVPAHSQPGGPNPHLTPRDPSNPHSPQHSFVPVRKRRETRDRRRGVSTRGVSVRRLRAVGDERAPAVALRDEVAGAGGALCLEFGSDFGGGGAGWGCCASGGFEEGAAGEAHGVFDCAPGVGCGFWVCV